MSKGWSVPNPFSSNEDAPSFIDEVDEYANSPESILYFEVDDAVMDMLERADVDGKARQIIWEDGQRLSITESALRIRAEYPDYPLDAIEEHVIEWLLGEFAPLTYTPEQLDELDRLTQAWTEDHTRQATTAPKGSRTRHS
jgi:hypothetical protein